MAKKIGIPRSLFYYRYYPMWKTFLEELGAEIIVSDPSCKRILDDGVKSCVDEACLPVKLFHGHVLNLKDKVDYLFIPRITSVSEREYICPKFGGLPDMVRHTIKDLPEIIDTEINLWKSRKNGMKAALELGAKFNCTKSQTKQAYIKALNIQQQFREHMRNNLFPDFPGMFRKKKVQEKTISGCEPEYKLNIAVIGHTYNLYDDYVNMDIMFKLMNRGVNVITVDMVEEDVINRNAATLNKPAFWDFGRKALGGAMSILDRDDVDGIMYLMSFGCGVDSFMADLIERRIRRSKDIPFIILILDEHSGEAGLDTRLEAFVDMIRWRYSNEADIPSHG